MLPPAEYDAMEANRAIAGAGTDEGTLIELLVTRTNSEIAALKTAYMASVQAMFLLFCKLCASYVQARTFLYCMRSDTILPLCVG